LKLLQQLRFSPSPKSYCHLGLARTALVLDLLRRRTAGDLLIRLDDLVGARAAALGPDAPLLEGLRALGIGWDHDPWRSSLGPLAQSARLDLYRGALDRLVRLGTAYGCDCPPKRERTHECWCREGRRSVGPPPVFRFRVDRAGTTRVIDLARGELRLANAGLSDPVLIRRDGRPTYYLAYPTDDAALGVSLPLFERSVQTTQLYMLIREALGCPVATTAHIGRLIAPPSNREVQRVLGDRPVFDLSSYFSVGIPPSDVVLMLLHSLFGAWRGPYPEDLDEVAFTCDWRKLKSFNMHLPLGVLKSAARSRRRPTPCALGAGKSSRVPVSVAAGDASRLAALVDSASDAPGPRSSALAWRFEAWLTHVLALTAATPRRVRHPGRSAELLAQTSISTRVVMDCLMGREPLRATAGLMDLTAAVARSVAMHGARDEIDNVVLARLCRLLAPLAPETADAGWRQLGHTTTVHQEAWPPSHQVEAPDAYVRIIVQVNSRKVATIDMPHDVTRERLAAVAATLDTVTSRLSGPPKRVIVIAARLVNVIGDEAGADYRLARDTVHD
jgi:hypothetical protein